MFKAYLVIGQCTDFKIMPLTHPNTNTCSEKPPTDPNAIVPTSPPHHKGGRSIPRGAPCMSEPKGAAEITSIVVTLFLIPDSPNSNNLNQQGWLPPCRPDGLRWQDQLNSNTHTRHISTPHLQPPTQASISTSHPKPAGISEKRLPAPHTTRAVEQIRTGTRVE